MARAGKLFRFLLFYVIGYCTWAFGFDLYKLGFGFSLLLQTIFAIYDPKKKKKSEIVLNADYPKRITNL